MSDEIETLRKRVAELDIDVAAWTNTAHILDSRAEKAKARIAELEKKLEGMADLAQGEFSRAEKAEAALTEARDRLKAADRMAEALGWFLFRHSNPMSGTKELDEYLSLKETGQ